MVEINKVDSNERTQPDTFIVTLNSDEFWDLASLCMDGDSPIRDSERQLQKDILGQGRKIHSEVENMMEGL